MPVAGMARAGAAGGDLALALLAGPIPLACSPAIPMFVAWNMGEWREFVHLESYRSRSHRVTLLGWCSFSRWYSIWTVAVEFGIFAACITFIYRISSLSRSERLTAADHPALLAAGERMQAWRRRAARCFLAPPCWSRKSKTTCRRTRWCST